MSFDLTKLAVVYGVIEKISTAKKIKKWEIKNSNELNIELFEEVTEEVNAILKNHYQIKNHSVNNTIIIQL
jgi:hypothetical protein